MFVNYNAKLHERSERAKLLEEEGAIKYDPICLEELNFSSEWMTGIEGPSNEFVYTDDGLTWATVEEAMGIHERLGAYTRRAQNVENDDI